MGKRRRKKNRQPNACQADAEPFAIVKRWNWFRRDVLPYARKHKAQSAIVGTLLALGVVLCLFFLIPFGQKLGEHSAGWLIEVIESSNDRVRATVLEFDKRNARVTVRFDNTTESPVVITQAYLGLKPPDGASLMLPEPLREELSVFDKMALELPTDCGFATTKEGLELITFLLASKSNLVLNAGSTNINLHSTAGSLDALCKQFVDDTAFEFGIHFDLVDADGGLHVVDLPLGKYSRNDRKRLLVGDSLPLSVDLLPSPTVTATNAQEFAIAATEQRTLLTTSHDKRGKPYRRQFFRNHSPHKMTVIISDPHEELVPVVIVDEKVGIAVNLSVESEEGGSIFGGDRTFENLVSADGGKTRTTLGDVVSNAWNSAKNSRKTGGVRSLHFPRENYSLLVGKDKWAQVLINARCSLNRSGWVKLFPPNELNISMIRSNRSSLAKASHHVDTGWTHIPDVDDFIGSNKELLLVVEGEVVLDLNSPHAFKGGSFKFTPGERSDRPARIHPPSRLGAGDDT
jgi:hypothetical protein